MTHHQRVLLATLEQHYLNTLFEDSQDVVITIASFRSGEDEYQTLSQFVTVEVTVDSRSATYSLYGDWFDAEIGDLAPERGYLAMATCQNFSDAETQEMIETVDAYLRGGPPPPSIPVLRRLI